MARKQDWIRLGGAIRDRRVDLGLTQEDMAARGGPSPATIRIMESGGKSSYRAATLRMVEQALSWPSGRCRQILTGEPVVQEVKGVSVASLEGLDDGQLELIADQVLAALPPATVGRVVQRRLAK